MQHKHPHTHTHRMGEASNCTWTLLILICASGSDCKDAHPELPHIFLAIHLWDPMIARHTLQQQFRSIYIFVIIGQLRTVVCGLLVFCELFRCYQIYSLLPACVLTWFDVYWSTWHSKEGLAVADWTWATVLRQKQSAFHCFAFLSFSWFVHLHVPPCWHSRTKNWFFRISKHTLLSISLLHCWEFGGHMLPASGGRGHGCWLKQAVWMMDFLLQTCRCFNKFVLVLKIALIVDLLLA